MPDGNGTHRRQRHLSRLRRRSDVHRRRPPKRSRRQARIITSLLYRHWNAWQSPTRSHIVYVPLDGGTPRDLTPGPFDAPPFSVGGGDEFDVSPDGKELVFARNTDDHPELSTNSDLFIVPVSRRRGEADHDAHAAPTPSPQYSPDGKWIAYRSQARAGYESDLWELWLYDRATGTVDAPRRRLPELDRVGRLGAGQQVALHHRAARRAHDGIFADHARRQRYDMIHGRTARSATSSVARQQDALLRRAPALTGPTEIYAIDTRTAKPQRLTHENDALLRAINVGVTRDFYVDRRGRREGPGAPRQAARLRCRSKKYPALVLIHGGPQGAWGDAWSYRWNPQIFAARGYVVLMPNPRGSTGFGQKFVEEISRRLGRQGLHRHHERRRHARGAAVRRRHTHGRRRRAPTAAT